MPGVPRLQELEGRAVAHLADEDPVGPVAHGGHDGVAPGVHRGLHEDLHLVRRLALKLRGVLNDEDAIWSPPAITFKSALANVVFPEPVPPPMRMLSCACTARSNSCSCCGVRMPFST